MQVQRKSMNWFPKESAYDLAERTTQWRRARAQQYLAEQSNLATTISGIQSSLSQGISEITAKVALARVQKKA